MFDLTFSRPTPTRHSTGRSLLLLSISSLLHVQTTVQPFILVYRLSDCLVLIAICDMQRALSVNTNIMIMSPETGVDFCKILGEPKYWGKGGTVIIDESLGVSQLWGNTQSALEFCPIHCPNGRLGQDLGF